MHARYRLLILVNLAELGLYSQSGNTGLYLQSEYAELFLQSGFGRFGENRKSNFLFLAAMFAFVTVILPTDG